MAVEAIEETHENPETTESSEQETRKIDIMDEDEDSSSSPRGVLDMVSVSSGTDSDRSNSCSLSEKPLPEKVPAARNAGDYKAQWKGAMESLMKKSMKRFATISLLGSYDSMSRKSMKKKLSRIRSSDDSIDCEGLRAMKPSWRSFDYKELAAATDNFNKDNLLGKGGHAEVYKGCLPDGQIVAVKKLKKKDKEEEDGIGDFLSELGIIAHINHPNAAHLLGFGIDGGLHLVLQFSPQGSLASVLHGSEDSPSWSIRFKVAVGVAEGLKYMHHDCQRRIIHRDIKASNILLTQDHEALLSDFGLAKWLPDKWAHHIVHPIEGTFGYLAPEYFMHGLVNEKTDVFAYGVLLLEIITGRLAIDLSRQSLVMWAKPLLESNNIKDLVDPRLGEDYNVTELKRAMFTASMCIHHLSAMRPYMNRVVELLNGDIGSLELKQKSMTARSSLPEGCDLEDYTCSTYLKELTRHKELALE